MASDPKKLRICGLQKLESNYNKKQWISSIMSLCTSDCWSQITLTPMKILNCNATASRCTSFTKAFCDTEYYRKGAFVFGDAFKNGMNILSEYFYNGNLPKDKQCSFVLKKLLDFMNGDRSVHINEKRRQNLTASELTIMLANHLFGKLAPSACYLVDKNCTPKNGGNCFCGDDSCKLTGVYGDSSVGNIDVWHGNLDIVINNDAPIKLLEDIPDSSEGKSALETKGHSAWEGNEQIIAQTIVFSYLQRRIHPERDNFLTPCIGIKSSELIVMLYDSENDVLLESSSIPLFTNAATGCEFSYTAILVSWLTVNYKFLCTGLPEDLKKNKSNFCDLAKPKIEVYKENLRFGSVHYDPLTVNMMPKGKILYDSVRCSSSMHEHTRKMMDILWALDEEDDDL